MKSLGQKIQQIEGLHDTKDVDAWENEFIENVVVRTDQGKNTASLTEKQIDIIERIYRRHFA